MTVARYLSGHPEERAWRPLFYLLTLGLSRCIVTIYKERCRRHSAMNGRCKYISMRSAPGYKSNGKFPNAFIMGNMVYVIQLD
jgi:hypothetical protein